MKKYQTYAEINLDNLVNNYKYIKQLAGDRNVIPVIKADAYGHGAEVFADVLVKHGANLFAVSSIYEAMCLREYGIKADIMILGYVPEYKIHKLLDNDIIPAIYNLDFAKELNYKAKERGIVARVHIKINTGMNRLGFSKDQIDDAFKELKKLTNLKYEGMFSHFATSDEVDKTYSKYQFEIYKYAMDKAKEYDLGVDMFHISNSAAITDLKEYHLDAVRAGIILYGIYPSEIPNENNELKPVMSFYSSITNIFDIKKGETVGYGRTFKADKDMKIAVFCVGYADGYNRKLSNCGKVLINDKYYANVVGNVCMDMTMVAIDKDMDVKIGDKVELIGEHITVSEIADKCETIPYEILCLINKRVKRRYILDGKEIEIM